MEKNVSVTIRAGEIILFRIKNKNLYLISSIELQLMCDTTTC